jgi:hypothetical protein
LSPPQALSGELAGIEIRDLCWSHKKGSRFGLQDTLQGCSPAATHLAESVPLQVTQETYHRRQFLWSCVSPRRLHGPSHDRRGRLITGAIPLCNYDLQIWEIFRHLMTRIGVFFGAGLGPSVRFRRLSAGCYIKALSLNKCMDGQGDSWRRTWRQGTQSGAGHFVFIDSCYLRKPITGGANWARFNHGKSQMLYRRRWDPWFHSFSRSRQGGGLAPL